MNLWQSQLRMRMTQCSPHVGPFLIDFRSFHKTPPSNKKHKKVGGGNLKELFNKKYRNLVYNPDDLNKRPSDLEIAKKELPENTPTLGERMDRDVYNLFHQRDEKQGYHSLRRQGTTMAQEVLDQAELELKTRPWQSFKEQFNTIYQEVKKLGEEDKERFMNPNMNIDKMFVRPGERKKEWGFQSQEEVDHQWILTQDSDWGEGYSAANFEYNPLGYARLHGELSTRVPADGRTQAAGYVNISSVTRRKSFAREVLMEDWDQYTHLTMNVRGDGRKYLINIKVKRSFDILWNDRWHYPLFTRGGPYWQYVKIPWSKFYLGSRGTLQDKQFRVPLECGVVGISITLMDGISGPFQLELKDISLHNDCTPDDEQFAYEMYKIPSFWAGH